MKLKKIKALKDGWSKWQQPIMDGYLMGCCDCGLVHEMQFLVLKKTKGLKDGSFEAKPLDKNKYRVSFRARRYKTKAST